MPNEMRRLLPLLLFWSVVSACGEDQDRYMLDDASEMDASDGGAADGPVPVCGNGVIDEGETCDDGNALTETCAYGEASCTVCDATCHEAAGPLAFCGDGVTDREHEDCDAPGSSICSATCELTCAHAEASTSELLSTGCYHYFETDLTSYEAMSSACTALGGHLASFESNAEWRTVRRMIRTDERSGYIGLTTDEALVIGAWASGAPYVAGRLDAGVYTEGEGAGQCGYTDGYDIFFVDCDDLEGDAQYFCEVSTCGDGQVFANEACDDGNLVDGDGCDSNCRLTGCGNDVLNEGEDCDDGNLVDGDGCASTCTFPCGGGSGATFAVDTAEGCFVAFDTDTTYARARALCERNGLTLAQPKTLEAVQALDEAVHEGEYGYVNRAWIGLDDIATNGTFVWNDGSTTAASGWEPTRPTSADNGEDCVSFGESGSLRDAQCFEQYAVICQATSCGDGTTDAGEACDDGNLENGDGCDASCTVTACGNRIVTAGEDCDDGNTVNGDGCPGTCILPCGAGAGADRVEQTTRGCFLAYDDSSSFADAATTCGAVGGTLARVDDAAENRLVRRLGMGGTYGAGIWFNLTDEAMEGTFTDTSGAPLTFFAFSGGEPNDSSHFENCGELTGGARWNDLSCNDLRGYVCEIATCGNGQVDANEACDEANAVNGDGCDVNCSASACGNGIIAGEEQCDDGNLVDGDGCESDCSFACGDDPGATAVYANEGSCYRFFDTSMTYAGAAVRCASPSGGLLEIESAGEQAYIGSIGGAERYFGLSDVANEGTFVWASGDPVTFTAWALFEPNNSGNEDCVVSNASGQWNDVRCDDARGFICESPLP